MGANQSKDDVLEDPKYQEMQKLIEEKGIKATREKINKDLDAWKEKEIKICVTGSGGVGKSHFINAIRGLDYGTATEEQRKSNNDKYAVPGSLEATNKPTSYKFPTNSRIQLVEVPGVGTPTYPDLDTYCRDVPIATYDTFLVVIGQKVTHLELQLVRKIKFEMKKPFYIIRTKFDIDEENERRSSNPDIEKLTEKIRKYYQDKMKELGIRDEQVFLISNNHWDKWDFERLIDAIANFPEDLNEELIISLATLSKIVIERKVEVFKGRMWHEAFYFVLPLPVDLALQGVGSRNMEAWRSETKTKFYLSQLGLPTDEESEEYKAIESEFGERLKKLYNVDNYRNDREEETPVSFPITGRHYYRSMKDALEKMLDDMGKLATDFVDKGANDAMEKKKKPFEN